MSFRNIKSAKRLINRQSLRQVSARPELAWEIACSNFGGSWGLPVPSLAERHIVHVANFSYGNAGDALLPIALRDIVARGGIAARWKLMHAHTSVGAKEFKRLQASDGVVVGGGGLFLRDTNFNEISGWQWPISTEKIRALKVPLAVFAVGYNRFRNQEDFGPVFAENLAALVEKCAFFGLRNGGSIKAIRDYLPESLRSKVAFQPCMTTVVRKMYPAQAFASEPGRPFIALNCAFDRSTLRFGKKQPEILVNIARSLLRWSRDFEIRYFAHCPSDEQMLPVLEQQNVPIVLKRLYNCTPAEILKEMSAATLVLGMRGHAQMIPFGCGVPILSLISHDKVKWFLDDIDSLEWGVELGIDDLEEELFQKIRLILEKENEVRGIISQKMEVLWSRSLANVQQISAAFYK